VDLFVQPTAAAPEVKPANVSVSVVNAFGAPLSGATLELVTQGAQQLSAVADSGGRVSFAGVVPGLARIRARQIGFVAGELVVAIAPGDNVLPVVLDNARLRFLDTVKVVGSRRVTGRLDEFDARRAGGQTTRSITQDDIEKRNPPFLSQMLMNVPAIEVIDSAGKRYPVSRRGKVPDPNMGPGSITLIKCRLAIMVDGVMMPQSTDLDEIPPKEVYGVEVFAGAAMVPLQYGSSGSRWCGLIAIWTK
jgi:hypothetical protein